MVDSFYNTAQRMHKSSETLHNNNEHHNACYLAGYVVECYAKIIVGLSYGFNYDEAKEFSHDLGKLRQEFEYILYHSAYSSYMVDMRSNFPNILLGNHKWNPNKRYIDNSSEWNQTDSNNFQNEIQIAMQQIAQMRIDGHKLM